MYKIEVCIDSENDRWEALIDPERRAHLSKISNAMFETVEKAETEAKKRCKTYKWRVVKTDE